MLSQGEPCDAFCDHTEKPTRDCTSLITTLALSLKDYIKNFVIIFENTGIADNIGIADLVS